MNQFSYDLKEYRIEKGISQDKMAEMLGISQSVLSRLENGKAEPAEETVRKFKTLAGIKEETVKSEEKQKYRTEIVNMEFSLKQKKIFFFLILCSSFFTHEFGFLFAGYATYYSSKKKLGTFFTVMAGIVFLVYLFNTADLMQNPHVLPFHLFTPLIIGW